MPPINKNARNITEQSIPNTASTNTNASLNPGAKGPPGIPGPQGPMGPKGVRGVPGPSGDTVTTGGPGPRGATGPAGATGAQGVTGQQGPDGARGPTGPQGLAGPTGAKGPTGPTGAQGPIGARGPQGLAGLTGATGAQGAKGATGPQGLQGVVGNTGAAGPRGAQGATGNPANLSSLPTVTTVASTDYVVTVVSGVVKKTLVSDIMALNSVNNPVSSFTSQPVGVQLGNTISFQVSYANISIVYAQLFIGSTPEGSRVQINGTSPQTVSSMVPASAATYTVKIFDTSTAGTLLATSNTFTTTALAAPGVPTSLAATPSGTSFTITWVAPSPGGAVATYTLRFKPSSGSVYTTLTGITGLTRTVSGLTASTAYDISVQSVNATASSAFTATVNATTGTTATVDSFAAGIHMMSEYGFNPNGNTGNSLDNAQVLALPFIRGMHQPVVSISAGNQYVLMYPGTRKILMSTGLYNQALGDYSFTVRADGVDDSGNPLVFTKNVVVHNRATTSPYLFIPKQWISDTEGALGGYSLPANNGGLTITIPDAVDTSATIDLGAASSFLFATSYDFYGSKRCDVLVKTTTTSFAGLYGDYNMTLTYNGVAYPFTISIIHNAPAEIVFNSAGSLYDSYPIGTVIGKIKTYCDADTVNVTLTDDLNGTLQLQANGDLVTKKSLVGLTSLPFSIQSINMNVTSNATFTPTVGAGTILPATNMTLTVASGLNNWTPTQSIGTPTVTGMPSGTPTWTITNPEDTFYFDNVTPFRLFTINSTTGAISAVAVLAARTHSITVTAKLNGTICTQTFSVPVAWYTGASTPIIYVGAGMAALHGAGVGFDTLEGALSLFNMSGSPTVSSQYAGATIKIAYNADPDYYANDNGARTTNWGLRFGLRGPFIIDCLDVNQPRPRVGGHVGKAGEGSDMGNKGFFNIEDGDVIIRNLEVSYCTGGLAFNPDGSILDNSHGISGIRKNAERYGDITVDKCWVHDCNNGLESGRGPYHTIVTDSVFSGCGTAYAGSGATHAIYAGDCAETIITNSLFYHSTNGHNIKSRAYKTTITNVRTYEGETGTLSNCINIPNGGTAIISGCKIQRGPNTQNPYAIQFSDETYNGDTRSRIHNLTLINNDFSIMSLDGNHFGHPVAVGIAGVVSLKDGSSTHVTATNNRFYLSSQLSEKIGYVTVSSEASYVLTETGTTMLTAPIPMDLSDPMSPATHGALTRQSWLSIVGLCDSYINGINVQMDCGADDILLPHISPAGTVVMTLSAYGGYAFASNSPTNPRINPFTSGTTWAFDTTGQYDPSVVPWAPNGRYLITAINGGVNARVTLVNANSGPVAGAVDFIKVTATAPNGTLCTWRFYIIGT